MIYQANSSSRGLVPTGWFQFTALLQEEYAWSFVKKLEGLLMAEAIDEVVRVIFEGRDPGRMSDELRQLSSTLAGIRAKTASIVNGTWMSGREDKILAGDLLVRFDDAVSRHDGRIVFSKKRVTVPPGIASTMADRMVVAGEKKPGGTSARPVATPVPRPASVIQPRNSRFAAELESLKPPVEAERAVRAYADAVQEVVYGAGVVGPTGKQEGVLDPIGGYAWDDGKQNSGADQVRGARTDSYPLGQWFVYEPKKDPDLRKEQKESNNFAKMREAASAARTIARSGILAKGGGFKPAKRTGRKV